MTEKIYAVAALPKRENQGQTQVLLGRLKFRRPDGRFAPVPNLLRHPGEWLALATQRRGNLEDDVRRAIQKNMLGGYNPETIQSIYTYEDPTRVVEYVTIDAPSLLQVREESKYAQARWDTPTTWREHITSREEALRINQGLSILAEVYGMREAPVRQLPRGTLGALKRL